MTLKPQNFEPLLAWLDAGCPHVAFNISYAYNSVEDLDEEEGTSYSSTDDCGSVCCIAGYVYQQVTPRADLSPPWASVEEIAAEHLGLTPDQPDYKVFSYDLFNPNLAPDDCTPAQAAEAVRRVMKGEYPWL